MLQNSQQIVSSSKESDGRASLAARVRLLTVSSDLTSACSHTLTQSNKISKSLAKIGLKIMRVEIKIPTHALTAEWL